jgi:regulator of sirC expression with transglutaminase-like and TPR domain
MSESVRHLGLVEEADIALDDAALALAALDHPDLDLSTYYALRDEMADAVKAASPGAQDPQQQAAALVRVLAGRFRFAGDSVTYDDPRNADLIRVMDTRQGLPITLSILYVALARRAGWMAHVINAPGHCLVALGPPPFLLIDPFYAGAVVDPAHFAKVLQTAAPDGSPVRIGPMSNRAVLLRLLLNQAQRAEMGDDPARALTVFERITVIAPEYSEGWWERARLELALGRPGEARASLTSLLEVTREPALRGQANEVLARLGP